MSFDHAGRIERLRGLMGEGAVDALLVSGGADLRYLTGYEPKPSERLTMLVVTGTDATLVMPELEAPLVQEGPVPVAPWSDGSDPVAKVAEMVAGAQRLALSDQTWLSFLLRLQEALAGVSWAPASVITRELRQRKDAQEMEALAAAGAAADRVAARLPDEVRFERTTERQLARLVAEMVVEEGHDVSWDPIVASGPNGASPHHVAGERVIEEGDLVVVDFGGRVAGYHSDTTRMFSVGRPLPGHGEVHRVVMAAGEAGREAARPGAPAGEVDRIARSVIEDAGYGRYFIHRTGHGIGLEVHEHPYIVSGNDQALEPGMAFSVEPGIYLPGRFGVRIEDIVAVTENGVRALNDSDRGLVAVT